MPKIKLLLSYTNSIKLCFTDLGFINLETARMKGSRPLFRVSVDWVLISRGVVHTNRKESNTLRELKLYYF